MQFAGNRPALGSGDPGAVRSAFGRPTLIDVYSLEFVLSGRPLLNRLVIAPALTPSLALFFGTDILSSQHRGEPEGH